MIKLEADWLCAFNVQIFLVVIGFGASQLSEVLRLIP